MYRFFKKNREAVKKYLLIFFLSIVSIGMVITLAPIPSMDSSRTDSNVLASVGGTNITTLELSQSIRNSPMGNNPRLIPIVANNILDDMVTERALYIQAKKMGIEVSDKEIYDTLKKIPWLYPEGNYVGADRARDLVAQQANMTLAQFEDAIRESLLREKMKSVVTDDVQVTPAEVLAEFRHRNAKAKIDYVLFDPSVLIKDVKVTPEGLAAYFKKNPAAYKLPEQRQVRYVLIDPDQVRAQVKIDDAELRQNYAQRLSDFRVPDRVKVAHILFKTTDKTPAEVGTIEKTAADVLNQIRAGGNFSELAKKYSEDSTAAQGGELGWIVHGQIVNKAFEDTAFSLKSGEVSGLVKTEYGIHILKVEDKQQAHLESFDEVKESIRSELQKQRLQDALSNLASQLETQFKANPQEFEAIARKAGLEPKESPLFKYNQPVPDLGNTDSFENLAYQLRLNEVGTPIAVPKGQAIIQVIQIVPEHIPALDEVRARVEEDYRHDQSTTLAAEKAKQLAEQAQTGDFDKVAKAEGWKPQESKDFTAADYVEGVGNGTQLAQAFTLNPGETSGVVSVGTNSVVFRVVSHTPANEADFAGQRGQLTEELLDQKRSLMFEIFRHNLKEQYLRSGQLKINEAALKQFLSSYQTP